MKFVDENRSLWRYLLILVNAFFLVDLILIISSCLGLEFWLGELAVSFLPQQLILFLVILWINLAAWWLNRHGKAGLFKSGQYFVLTCSGLVLVWGLVTIYNFAWALPDSSLQISFADRSSIKVAIFNKLLTNDNFEEIEQIVRRVDADVVGFVEISPVSALRSSLAAKYPYQVWSFDEMEVGTAFLANLAIFSKTELVQVEFQNLRDSPLLKAETKINDRDYQIVLVHPFAPYLPRLFPHRNEQLLEIARVVAEQQAEGVPQILMGDFNTTPWSPNYRKFVGELDGLYNTGQGRGINFTWDALKFKGLTAEVNSIL